MRNNSFCPSGYIHSTVLKLIMIVWLCMAVSVEVKYVVVWTILCPTVSLCRQSLTKVNDFCTLQIKGYLLLLLFEPLQYRCFSGFWII